MRCWAVTVEQAGQYNDAIQVVRNWLPEAEAELKLGLHSIPDDEESIMHAIDNHEVYTSPLLFFLHIARTMKRNFNVLAMSL